MQQKALRSKFPLGDRFAMGLNCCAAKGDAIEQQKTPLFTFEEEFNEPHHKNLALKIKIKETGSLKLDPHVTHPFVRLHVVDTNTCKYMAKSDAKLPGSYNRESCQVMDTTGQFESKPTDFIMPVATRFFDMRIKGQTQCSWDEQFIINELAQNILKPNVLLLFEILECNPMLIA